MRCEISHGGLHARARELHAGEFQAHFTARQGRDQGQVVAIAQMPNAEHAAFDLAQARAQGAVKTLVNDATHRIGIDPLGHHDAGEDG